jgi:predicted DNA-binding transcriptional regulator YafY
MSRPPWSVQMDDRHEPEADGWVALRIRFDSEEEACSVILGLGPRVDVIEPQSLRDRVAAEAASVVERAKARPPERSGA